MKILNIAFQFFISVGQGGGLGFQRLNMPQINCPSFIRFVRLFFPLYNKDLTKEDESILGLYCRYELNLVMSSPCNVRCNYSCQNTEPYLDLCLDIVKYSNSTGLRSQVRYFIVESEYGLRIFKLIMKTDFQKKGSSHSDNSEN